MKSNKKYSRKKTFLSVFPVILILCTVFFLSGCARYSHRDIETIPPEDTRLFSAKVYFIDQKFWTIGDKFTISDENGTPVFFCQREGFYCR